MISIAAVILHHGEASSLERVLSEVSGADEIIVVHDGPEIPTALKAVLGKYPAQVFARKLNNDFSAQRNFGLSKVNSDWTLFVDQDESVSPELWEEIRSEITQTMSKSFWISRRDIFLGQKLQHGETGQMQLLRLGRTKLGIGKWQRSVHEVWDVSAPHGFLRNPLWHVSSVTVTEFLQKLNGYAALEPGNRSPLSRRKVLFQLVFYPPGKFLQAVIWRSGWRDGARGWIHAFLMAYYSLIVRVYCWEVWHVSPTNSK